MSKLILGIVDNLKNMSDENGQEIDLNLYDNDDELIKDEEAAALQLLEVADQWFFIPAR